jgi:hypothetical protein
MPVTLQLDPYLESRVKQHAAKAGLSPEEWLLSDLRSRLNAEAESELLAKAMRGKPAAFWEHDKSLIAKRDAREIKPSELSELIQMSDELERDNAVRIEALVQLSELRGTDIKTLKTELGLTSHRVSV